MDPLMGVPLGAGVLLACTGVWLGRALPPAWAVRLLTVASLVVASATGFVLAVAAFDVAARLPSVAAAGGWSAPPSGRDGAVPAWLGIVAAGTVVVLLAAALRRSGRTVRDLWTATRLCRQLPVTAGGLVLVDDDIPDAYAIRGLNGRIVVTTAMLRALPATERRALLAHEAAHLRCHHHAYVHLARLASAANPLLRPAARAIERAVERWADEIAADEVGDRRAVASAVARAGVARAEFLGIGELGAGPGRHPRAAPMALPAADRAAVERARALLAGPPPRRRVLVTAVAALVALTAVAAIDTGQDTEHRIDAAQQAYATSR